MKLIKTTEAGLLKFNNLTAVAGNTLADMLGIRHDNIMRTIERVIKYEEYRKTDSSNKRSEITHIEEENNVNFNAVFKEWEYTNSRGKTYKTYIMNEDALYLVVANSQSAKAHKLKVWFKSEFNEMKMERHIRQVSRQRSHDYTDELILLQEKLKEEKSGSAPFIIPTIQQKIHKKATGRATKRGGIDQDALTGEEDFKIAKLRTGVANILGESQHLRGRQARDKVYQYIKAYK